MGSVLYYGGSHVNTISSIGPSVGTFDLVRTGT